MTRKISLYISYLAAFLMPFYIFRFEYSIFKTNIFEIIVLLSFFFLILYLCQSKKKVENLGLLPFALLALSFIAIFLAEDKIKAIGIFKGWFLIPAIYAFIVANLFDSKSVTKLSLPIFISVLIVSIWALLQRFGLLTAIFYQANVPEISEYLSISSNRVIGPFDSPNFLAMYLVPGLFLSIPTFFLFRKKIIRIVVCLLAVIPLAAIIMSASRAGIIALVASIGLILIAIIIRQKNRLTIIVAASLIGLAILFVGYFSFFDKTRLDSNNSRMKIYTYSLEMIREKPLTGIGLGSYHSKISQISKNDQPFQLYVLDYALHPHNLFLAMWLNLGFFGLAVFILIVGYFYWQNRELYKYETQKIAYLLAMSAILIHGLFDTTYFKNDLSAIFWLTLAFTVIENRDKIKKRSS